LGIRYHSGTFIAAAGIAAVVVALPLLLHDRAVQSSRPERRDG
jgi:hypothetical protein